MAPGSHPRGPSCRALCYCETMATEAIELTCPRGDPLKGTLKFEMTKVYAAQNRIPEVAYVNTQKAPELLAVFNEAYLDLTRALSWLEVEVGAAEAGVQRRRSTVILDLSPDILKKKGYLKSSQDLREACVNDDDEYQALMERQTAILAMKEFLRGKLKALEMAYTSVKKIIGDKPMLGGRNPYAGHNPDDQARAPEPGMNIRVSGMAPAADFEEETTPF
jgi:hypothetical protein